MIAKPHISLSISIVSYYSPAAQLTTTIRSLAAALQALNRHFQVEPLSVVLVDNSEFVHITAEEVASLQEILAPAQAALSLIQGNGNVGYGGGHNFAISASRTDFHLVLNPDVTMAEDSLVEGIAYLKANPDVLIASPRARGGSGRRQYLCKRQPSVLVLLIRGFLPFLAGVFGKRLARYEMRDLSETEPTVGVPIVSGCFMLCRRKPLQAVKGFDERYFLYFEDFDLSLRLGSRGKLAYVPTMKIIHVGGKTARKGLRHVRHFLRSGIRFFNQWGWRWW